MRPTTCPDIETLFIGLDEARPEVLEHLDACPSCAAMVEEHRQLEKDLLRISDPLPPPDFVQLVMAKVEKEPVPVRREVWTGVGILVAAMVGGVFVLVDTGAATVLGVQVAQSLVWMRSFLSSAPEVLRAVWLTAAGPVTVSAALLLAFVLVGLRKLAADPAEVQVSA